MPNLMSKMNQLTASNFPCVFRCNLSVEQHPNFINLKKEPAVAAPPSSFDCPHTLLICVVLQPYNCVLSLWPRWPMFQFNPALNVINVRSSRVRQSILNTDRMQRLECVYHTHSHRLFWVHTSPTQHLPHERMIYYGPCSSVCTTLHPLV